MSSPHASVEVISPRGTQTRTSDATTGTRVRDAQSPTCLTWRALTTMLPSTRGGVRSTTTVREYCTPPISSVMTYVPSAASTIHCVPSVTPDPNSQFQTSSPSPPPAVPLPLPLPRVLLSTTVALPLSMPSPVPLLSTAARREQPHTAQKDSIAGVDAKPAETTNEPLAAVGTDSTASSARRPQSAGMGGRGGEGCWGEGGAAGGGWGAGEGAVGGWGVGGAGRVGCGG